MLAWTGTHHSQPRWHYITELCWSESLPMCCSQRTSCKMQQESVSLQHALQTFTYKHTHACLDSISLWGHSPASYAHSNPITYPKPLRPLMSCTAGMSSLCRWNEFPALHHRTCTWAKGFMSKRLIFMYSSTDAWICRPPRALMRAYSTFQTSFRSTNPLQHLEAAWDNVMR